MKTKLSFWTLPLCLGTALALALAGCTGDSGNNSPPPAGGNSGGNTPPMSSTITSEEVKFSENFAITVEYETVRITGTINAAKKDPLVKLEFLIANGSGWLTYQGKPVTGTISYSVSDSISLVRLSDAEIDLNNSAIPCGTHNMTVNACSSTNRCSNRNGSFEKPAYMCAVSSSGTELSSSSEAVWKFGPPQFIDVSLNVSATLGAGSFVLSGDDGQPSIEVFNGKIRYANAVGADEVVPGTAYSSKENYLGSQAPTSSKLSDDEGVQNGDYYLIYLNDGNKYLLQFKPKTGTPWPSWPKSCTYWIATESP